MHRPSDQVTAEEHKQAESRDRAWPLCALAFVYLVSLILAGMSLPGLDGVEANIYRVGLYAGASGIFWVRILISRARKETNRGYYFYAVLVLTMPFLAWPLQDWLW